MMPGAKSMDLPLGPDAPQAVKEVTSTPAKAIAEKTPIQTNFTNALGIVRAVYIPAPYSNELNADLTALSPQPVLWLLPYRHFALFTWEQPSRGTVL
jgi:hypothetical protein